MFQGLEFEEPWMFPAKKFSPRRLRDNHAFFQAGPAPLACGG